MPYCHASIYHLFEIPAFVEIDSGFLPAQFDPKAALPESPQNLVLPMNLKSICVHQSLKRLRDFALG
jgi:hypothetical protein